MKRLFTALLLVSVTTLSFGQQDPQFSQNMFNKLYSNPAVAGSNDAICANLLYRTQWVGFGKGAPKTGVFGVEGPLGKFGVGLSVLSDKYGFFNNLDVKLAVAYHLPVGNTGKLGIGVDIGYMQLTNNGDYVFNDPNDPLIPVGSVSGSAVPDLGAGLYYNSQKAYVGVSASHLIENDIDLGETSYTTKRHYYLTGGYSFTLSPSLALKPSVFVKSDGTSTQVDINANVHIKDVVWIGASYRLQDAVVLMAGINIFKGLRLGYSYDLTTSPIKTYSSGSHEIMLGYCYKITKKKTYPIKNVRYL
jgi:type IX secretion system PorP/SprF family membrane protein